MIEFDARKNLYNVVRSVLVRDKPNQALLDAATSALDRLEKCDWDAGAHATELAWVLFELARWHRNDGKDTDEPLGEFLLKSATALATLPAKALERAKAKDEALRSIVRGNSHCRTANQTLPWAQNLARNALLDDDSLIHSDRGGFIDGNDHKVISGDRVEYRFENHRRGILNEALQDGDAFVTWDDGSHRIVKWCNLAKVI